MNKVDIENTQARLFVGPPLSSGAELRFLPGINHVDAAAWDETKQRGSVPSWLKMGFLKEHGDMPEIDEVPELLNVDEVVAEASAMAANQVVASIEQMGPQHKQLLEALADRDNREAVRLAAKLRLDMFDPKKAPTA